MASRHVETRILVDASPERVFAVLTNLDDYGSWNRVLSLKLRDGGQPRRGARIWLKVKPSPLPIPCVLTVVEPGRELRWNGGPKGLVHGSHYFELHPIPDQPNKTEVIHAETFSGLLVPLIWPLMSGQLNRLYTALNEGLAAHAREA